MLQNCEANEVRTHPIDSGCIVAHSRHYNHIEKVHTTYLFQNQGVSANL